MGIVATIPTWRFDIGVSSTVVVGDLLAFAMGGPLVHAVHQRSEDATGSFIIRLLLPVTLAGGSFWVAWAGSRCSTQLVCNADSAGWAAYGGLLAGMAIATTLDVALFGWQKRVAKHHERAAAWTVAPYPSQGGGGLAFCASF